MTFSGGGGGGTENDGNDHAAIYDDGGVACGGCGDVSGGVKELNGMSSTTERRVGFPR